MFNVYIRHHVLLIQLSCIVLLPVLRLPTRTSSSTRIISASPVFFFPFLNDFPPFSRGLFIIHSRLFLELEHSVRPRLGLRCDTNVRERGIASSLRHERVV